VAKAPNEVQELIENGFEYICDMDDLKFFRKRKQKRRWFIPKAH